VYKQRNKEKHTKQRVKEQLQQCKKKDKRKMEKQKEHLSSTNNILPPTPHFLKSSFKEREEERNHTISSNEERGGVGNAC